MKGFERLSFYQLDSVDSSGVFFFNSNFSYYVVTVANLTDDLYMVEIMK